MRKKVKKIVFLVVLALIVIGVISFMCFKGSKPMPRPTSYKQTNEVTTNR